MHTKKQPIISSFTVEQLDASYYVTLTYPDYNKNRDYYFIGLNKSETFLKTGYVFSNSVTLDPNQLHNEHDLVNMYCDGLYLLDNYLCEPLDSKSFATRYTGSHTRTYTTNDYNYYGTITDVAMQYCNINGNNTTVTSQITRNYRLKSNTNMVTSSSIYFNIHFENDPQSELNVYYHSSIHSKISKFFNIGCIPKYSLANTIWFSSYRSTLEGIINNYTFDRRVSAGGLYYQYQVSKKYDRGRGGTHFTTTIQNKTYTICTDINYTSSGSIYLNNNIYL